MTNIIASSPALSSIQAFMEAGHHPAAEKTAIDLIKDPASSVEVVMAAAGALEDMAKRRAKHKRTRTLAKHIHYLRNRALDGYRRATDLDDESIPARVARARQATHPRLYSEGFEQTRAAIDQDWKSIEAWVTLADLYTRTTQYAQARICENNAKYLENGQLRLVDRHAANLPEGIVLRGTGPQRFTPAKA